MNNLRKKYEDRFKNVLVTVADQLEVLIKDHFQGFKRIDRIVARAKSVDRFIEKAQKVIHDSPKYSDPLNQIQDQIGARIVTFFKDDVERVSNEVLKYFRHIEAKNLIPESESEFGYFGKHYILLIPLDITSALTGDIPPCFELQIKTLFQHSWSEANHDLGYKPNEDLSSDFKRKIAFTSAQAWGADEIFNDLFNSLNQREN